MNKQISAAWKPLAAIGLALALAGCGNKGGTASSSASGGSSDTLATVGGTPITRTDLNKVLEAQSGASVLPGLIDNQLLIQAGKDAGISVSDVEVAAELERQKKIEPRLGEELTKNPKLTDLINTQIRRNLVTQKLLTKDVKVSDDQLQKFFTTYKTYYEEPAKVKVGTLLTSTKARADAMSRALKGKTKTFEQLVAEQQKATDDLSKRSNAGDGFAPVDTLNAVFGEPEAKSIQALSKGGTTEPKAINVGAGQPIYVLFHVTDKQEPTKADFAALKPQIEIDYKMAQVAMEEVKKNKDNPPFDETLKRTRDAVQQQQQQQQMQEMQQNPMAPPPKPLPPPSLRDVLTLILRPRQQNILTDLRAKGTVKIDDPSYTTVAEQYKAIPTPVPPAAGGATGTADANAAPATNSAMPDAGAPDASAPTANSAAPANSMAPAVDGPVTNAAPAPATP